MGQRHQLFVIAKVRNRYRGLAAVHNQWLYGGGALQRCYRLLNILQAKENRVPIAQELRGAREQPDAFWSGNDNFQPFPFVATCLTVGSSFDPDVGYQARVHPLAFNTSLDEVDNNDGVTVVDISDADHLGYCFAFLERRQPLKASAYLSQYVKAEDTETLLQYDQVVKQLESLELISAEALQSAWPKDDVGDEYVSH